MAADTQTTPPLLSMQYILEMARLKNRAVKRRDGFEFSTQVDEDSEDQKEDDSQDGMDALVKARTSQGFNRS